MVSGGLLKNVEELRMGLVGRFHSKLVKICSLNKILASMENE